MEFMCEVDTSEFPIDVTAVPNDAICKMAKAIFRADGHSIGPKDYYCGITNGIEEIGLDIEYRI